MQDSVTINFGCYGFWVSFLIIIAGGNFRPIPRTTVMRPNVPNKMYVQTTDAHALICFLARNQYRMLSCAEPAPDQRADMRLGISVLVVAVAALMTMDNKPSFTSD